MTTCPTASSAGPIPPAWPLHWTVRGLDRAGLEQIRWVLTAGGIIATHVGVKPAGPPLASTNGSHPAP